MKARALASAVLALGIQPPLQAISRDQLCVTNGEITTTAGGRLAINTPSSRAIVKNASTPAMVEMRFTYLGPSADSKPLASGEIRRQIGFKLRSRNQCNLLYVMWHMEPDTKLAVLVKRNPGDSTHAQCGARGYTTVGAASVPIGAGESHILRASLTGDRLTVTADRRVVWEGSVPDMADGPVGLRTDNARFELEYHIGALPSSGPTAQCKASPED